MLDLRVDGIVAQHGEHMIEYWREDDGVGGLGMPTSLAEFDVPIRIYGDP